MTKRYWKARAIDAERRVTALQLPPPLTFDNLTICFSDKSVTLRGATFTVDANCVSIPLTNDQHLLGKAGWYSVIPADQR